MRLVTNAGPIDVSLSALLDRRVDHDEGGLTGGFDVERMADLFCAAVDWNAVRTTGGRLLDEELFSDIFGVLGGTECCPPPSTPACQCLHLLEVVVRDAPSGLEIMMVRDDDKVVADVLAGSATPMLVTPVEPEGRYSFKASAPDGGHSLITLRRWILQQEMAYDSDQPIRDLAVVDGQALIVGPQGGDLVALDKLVRTERLQELSGATSVAAFGRHVAVTVDGRVVVYRFAKGADPHIESEIALAGGDASVIASRAGTPPLLYVFGDQVHTTYDVSDAAQPAMISNFNSRLVPLRADLTDRHIVLHDGQGLELLSLDKPAFPEMTATIELEREIEHLLAMRAWVLAVRRDRVIDIVRTARKPGVVGRLYLEEWSDAYIPRFGRISQAGSLAILCRSDAMGLRVMRTLRNQVDIERLQRRRAELAGGPQ
jgi:hypothetical protein